jgi:hypothetical protein
MLTVLARRLARAIRITPSSGTPGRTIARV